MTRRSSSSRRLRRRAVGALAPPALALILAAGLPGSRGTSTAAGQPGGAGEPTPQTDASVPAGSVTMIGSSPAEAGGETWGVGQHGGASLLVRYLPSSGWSLGPALEDSTGAPLSGFRLATSESFRYPNPSPLSGEISPAGGGVLIGAVPEPKGGEPQQVVLVREPGGAFRETAPVPGEGEEVLLKTGEALFANNRPAMITTLEEAGGGFGALVAPVDESTRIDGGVLHWDGHAWSREAIEIPEGSSEQFEVLAMGASSPHNAWLLAHLSSNYPAGSVALFRRHVGTGGEPTIWRAVAPKPGGEGGEPLSVEGKQFTVPSGDQAQLLSVTADGLWIDGQRRDVQASTTMFFKPEGEDSGRVLAAWCKIPASAPEGTAPCKRELPEPLPVSPSRSFAWANASTPEGLGERVITGLPDGVTMRLDGTSFTRVLGLGGDAGASFGAAFSSAKEGWLGKQALPVHLTLEPVASRLAPWPVPFRRALLAIAPQPGAPVGSPSSQALAVGDEGEVARYIPGSGWTPESLLGPGGRHEAPRLRALAWPSANRAYAVGDLGQMWLWRGETGLWEPDPAVPINFRGNLLGIAFEPGNPARGYAVGQQGALLRYGKTWTQEPSCEGGAPQPCLPPQLASASFTSIAFAGSEAIVAYRKLVRPEQDLYEAGLLVNEGAGWHVDAGAAAVMGSGVPWAVAGLPDGGAAFSASGSSAGTQIFERQGAGGGWQATPVPFPGLGAPASLSLFREAGSLRAIASGSAPETYLGVENEPAPPPGFPPTLVPPYPLAADSERGVLRQTAAGWSDEEHDLNNAQEPPGEYSYYDTPYQPDPVAATLVDPTGTQGWAVGGIVNNQQPLLDTADVYRYPADGSPPVGVGTAPVSTEAGEATFAIAGGAQCAAPCADRAATRPGPDVWLSSALARVGEIAGVRAFLYTGPRVTTGQTAGPATLVVPYERELARYASMLAASPKPVYAAAGPTDLDGASSERLFELEFSGFAEPFGSQPAAAELYPSGRSGENCASTPGCQAAYYSLDSGGPAGRVRVIVLDDSTPPGEAQLSWLAQELQSARTVAREPAIVVGQADLSAQIVAGGAAGAAAGRIAEELVAGGASAYFYDSPERNVSLPLRAGGGSIPSFGSGTLGYVNHVAEESGGGFIGASGFLLGQVDVAARNPVTNVAPVTARLIPNIGELAMEARDGTFLRRSQAALFDGLARRPRSGNRAFNHGVEGETSPYIPIPSNCIGPECAIGLFPEYTFSSSRPDIGNFVEPNLAAGDPRAVLLGANGQPIPDPQSGLFCAYNGGNTTVTISAGGLSYSLVVTVQAGSVRRPCGTQPLSVLPSKQQAAPIPNQEAAPGPASGAPPPTPLPVPAPPVVAPPATPAAPAATPPPPFFVAPALAAFVPPFVPLPVPTPARPTPPSGTSAVTQPVEAPEREEEEEAAPESARADSVAYRAPEHEPSPAYLLGIIVLAAFAGASLRGRPGRRGREIRVAPATLSSMRSQRRMGDWRGPM